MRPVELWKANGTALSLPQAGPVSCKLSSKRLVRHRLAAVKKEKSREGEKQKAVVERSHSSHASGASHGRHHTGNHNFAHGQTDKLHHQSLDSLIAHLPLTRKRTASQDLRPADLFPSSHTPSLNPFLLLYSPIGLVVAGFRMATWLFLLFVDQGWLTNNNTSIALLKLAEKGLGRTGQKSYLHVCVLQTMLGVDVRWQNTDLIPQERHVLVSNHITTGDMMMLYKRPQRTIHLISSTVPARVTQTKNHRIEFQHASVASYDRLASTKSASSIHLFPEGGMTNGRGMMKFNRGFMRFSEGLPVVPVALRATLPWGVATHTLTSSILSNMFWFCFSPYVRLDLTVLPPVKPRLGESKAAYVERIQQKIAAELGIPILDFTLQAKKQMIKSAVETKAKPTH